MPSREFSPEEQAAVLPLQEELRAAGVPEDLVTHVQPYRAEDIPFMYHFDALLERGTAAFQSIFRYGTRKPLEELIESTRYLNQSQDVLVEWWQKKTKPLSIGYNISERSELEEFRPGVYIYRKYYNVPELGSFEGTLGTIELFIEDRTLPDDHWKSPGLKWFKRTGYRRVESWRTSGTFDESEFHITLEALARNRAEVDPIKSP